MDNKSYVAFYLMILQYFCYHIMITAFKMEII